MGTSASLEHIYKTHHKDEDRHSGQMFPNERGAFLKQQVGTGKKVLDIGCRNGALTKFFVEGNQVLGADIDSGSLEKAKGELGIETMHLDLNGEWPFEEGVFDAVVATEIIEHLYLPSEVARKIAHVLKENGTLVGSVPNAFSLINRMRLLLGRKRFTPLGDPTHINHFTRSELKSLLERYFHKVEIFPFGKHAWLDRFFPGFFSFMFFFTASEPRR